MRFLIDAQLPPALCHVLRHDGHIAEHVQEVGLADAEDAAIWQYAMSYGAIILTKDEDFALRKMYSPGGPSVVWLRRGNSTNRVLLGWLAPMLPEVYKRLGNGEPLLELI